jgi:broad specificity phosphatase PhoE
MPEAAPPDSPATITLLVRHAHTDAIGHWLCGRAAGVHLNAEGQAQADRLGRALSSVPLAAIYTSPIERAAETAHALARYQRVPVQLCEDLSEIEFGAWTGKSFAELEQDAEWRTFNTRRSRAVVPGGERPHEVQARILAALDRLAAAHPGRTIAVVSHGDVLRFALLHYAGIPLDEYHRIEIHPASVSALRLSPGEPRMLYVNHDSPPPDP